MYLIELGHLTVSLEHLICSEDADREPDPKTLPPGVFRITLDAGRVFDLTGEMAERARRHIAAVVEPEPRSARTSPRPRRPTVGRSVNPQSPRKRVPRPAEGVEGG